MSLRWKLFFSHFLVIVIGIAIVAVITGVISVVTFEDITEVTSASTPDPNGPTITLDEETTVVDSAMETALLLGLGWAIVISMGVAFVVSLTLSQRMASPIREMISATQSIAEGDYQRRVTYRSADEIGELAGHFNHMAQALGDTETTRRQLLADLTHELNTPLTSIVGCIEGLQDGTLVAPESSYEVIHDEALRLQRLVRDVQYLSAIAEDVFALQREAVDVGDLLGSVADKLWVQFESKAVALVIEEPPQPLSICADRDRMVQVLVNVLGNALQFTPGGGRVTAATQVVDDCVEFIVADTGIGIAQSDLKTIFQRFYRVEKSRNRRSGGSGIGLTIARYIVEAHGGRIWAESAGLDQGSQIHFTVNQTATS